MAILNTIRRLGAWGLGSLFIVLGAAAIFMPGSTLTGIIWLVLGLFITPAGRATVERAIDRDVSFPAVVVLSIALFTASGAVLPPDTAVDDGVEAANATPSSTTPKTTTTAAPTPTPTTTRMATPTTNPGTVADPELPADSYDPNTVMQAIGMKLEEAGISVRQAEVDEYGPVLAYDTTATTEGEIGAEMGIVAHYYAEGVSLSPDLLGIPVYVYGLDGDLIGSYEIDRDWAMAYNAGTMSSEEYTSRIAETWVYA